MTGREERATEDMLAVHGRDMLEVGVAGKPLGAWQVMHAKDMDA